MATVFRLTITIGKGEQAREREIAIDPTEISMGLLEDLEDFKGTRQMKDLKPLIVELFGLTNEEYRAITAKQFIQIAEALRGAVAEATDIPNG